MITSGRVWMNENHDLVCTVPVSEDQHTRPQLARKILVEGIRDRYPLGTEDPETYHSFVHACLYGALTVMEDTEEGPQYGVVLRHIETPVEASQ